ncbi:MAG TPA: DUF302 domain-containing protein [Steroidobacteraceae bacterium]|nr:DUF302 domain-containing protein [Steroidobacteraceae bacterium]
MTSPPAVEGLRTLPTQRTVADVLQRVQSIARAKGLTIFAQIDFSGDAERSGLALHPTGLVILGSPKAGTPLMVAAPTVAIDLPLKILAWQDAAGQTWVAYNEPAYVQARHHFPAELSKNIAALAALAEAAAAPGP